MKWNSNFIILKRDEKEIILKQGRGDKNIKMSKNEFEVLFYYVKHSNKEKLIIYFKDKLKINQRDLEKLIEKAIENNLLLEDNTVEKSQLFFQTVFKKNKRIFELFRLDLTHTILERLFENKFFQRTFSILILFTFSYVVFDLLCSPLDFKAHYMKVIYSVPILFSHLLGYIYLCAFLSTCIHELGHYFFYKNYGGKSSVFGFGLLFFLFPVFFNKIIINFLPQRKHRLICYLGGMLADILLFLSLLYYTKHFYADYPTVSFLFYCLMISITIRNLFNLNIFIPHTDGYFIFSEAIGNVELFKSAKEKLHHFFNNPNKINAREIPYLLYGLMSYLSLAISWLIFFFPILYYVYCVL